MSNRIERKALIIMAKLKVGDKAYYKGREGEIISIGTKLEEPRNKPKAYLAYILDVFGDPGGEWIFYADLCAFPPVRLASIDGHNVLNQRSVYRASSDKHSTAK